MLSCCLDTHTFDGIHFNTGQAFNRLLYEYLCLYHTPLLHSISSFNRLMSCCSNTLPLFTFYTAFLKNLYSDYESCCWNTRR
jgi:hypothetical protein